MARKLLLLLSGQEGDNDIQMEKDHPTAIRSWEVTERYVDRQSLSHENISGFKSPVSK